MSEETAEQKLQRYEFVIEAYVAELTRLREENERLRAAGGAHAVLKTIYLNGELPESLRAKAAASAIVHETPKLLPERQAIELSAEPPIPLRELIEQRKTKAALTEREMIEATNAERLEAERQSQARLAARRVLVRSNGASGAEGASAGNGSDEPSDTGSE